MRRGNPKPNFDPRKHTIYKPNNPEKYSGSGDIICRSSYEVAFCRWADMNPKIIKWSSESLVIPYKDPMKETINKVRRYYPDFLIYLDNGEVFLIEVKPYKETIPPKQGRKKSNKTKIHEHKTWKTNSAKWEAAKNYCLKNGMKFKLITEIVNSFFHPRKFVSGLWR